MCVYYCVESCSHIECYSDCSRRGNTLVDSFAIVLFNICSAVTVDCFMPVLGEVFVGLLVCREKAHCNC